MHTLTYFCKYSFQQDNRSSVKIVSTMHLLEKMLVTIMSVPYLLGMIPNLNVIALVVYVLDLLESTSDKMV